MATADTWFELGIQPIGSLQVSALLITATLLCCIVQMIYKATTLFNLCVVNVCLYLAAEGDNVYCFLALQPPGGPGPPHSRGF